MMLMGLLSLVDTVGNATLCDANPNVACFVLLVLAGTLLHLCFSPRGGGHLLVVSVSRLGGIACDAVAVDGVGVDDYDVDLCCCPCCCCDLCAIDTVFDDDVYWAVDLVANMMVWITSLG